jgi:transposase
MDKITRIGMDTSKKVFQIHGVDDESRVVVKKKLHRDRMLAFFATLAPTKVGLEACGAAHHWARELAELGHEVLLIAPQHAKRYVKRNKNDAADAKAVCEAMSRPDMTFVPAKSADQQAVLMLAGIRDRLTGARTQIANSIRGYAAEFGHVAPQGLDKIGPLVAELVQDKTLPKLAREMFAALAKDFAFACKRLEAAETKLLAWHKSNEMSRRLDKIAGVGPIGASLLVLKTPAPQAFPSARHYAAWIGLTPKDHSTGGKQNLGSITHAGDEMLRSVLVAGAMSVCRVAQRKPERVSPWLRELVARKPLMLAAVALANKTARIAWRMMMTGEAYDAKRGQLGTALAQATA